MRFLPVVTLALLDAICAPAATLSFSPAFTAATLGQTFNVAVAISGAADLFAYQFDVGFNPTILHANGVTEGPFLPSGGTTLFLPGLVDNAAGLVSATAGSLEAAISGVSGGGALATFSFTAVGSGQSGLTLLNVLALDSTLAGIAVTTQNGAVAVGVSAVPEPAAGLLVGLGVLVLAARRRGREVSLRGT